MAFNFFEKLRLAKEEKERKQREEQEKLRREEEEKAKQEMLEEQTKMRTMGYEIAYKKCWSDNFWTYFLRDEIFWGGKTENIMFAGPYSTSDKAIMGLIANTKNVASWGGGHHMVVEVIRNFIANRTSETQYIRQANVGTIYNLLNNLSNGQEFEFTRKFVAYKKKILSFSVEEWGMSYKEFAKLVIKRIPDFLCPETEKVFSEYCGLAPYEIYGENFEEDFE